VLVFVPPFWLSVRAPDESVSVASAPAGPLLFFDSSSAPRFGGSVSLGAANFSFLHDFSSWFFAPSLVEPLQVSMPPAAPVLVGAVPSNAAVFGCLPASPSWSCNAA